MVCVVTMAEEGAAITPAEVLPCDAHKECCCRQVLGGLPWGEVLAAMPWCCKCSLNNRWYAMPGVARKKNWRQRTP